MKVLRCDLCGKVDDGKGIFARVSSITFEARSGSQPAIEQVSIDVCQACLGEKLLAALEAQERQPLGLADLTRLAMDERHD